jgi:hypothetical protein
MRKRFRIGFGLLLLALIGGIAWLTLRPKEEEPVYQGHTLSFWLEGFDLTSAPHSPNYSDTSDAVRHLGTNAIPTLLRMLQTKDAPVTDKLFALAQKQHFITVRHLSADFRRQAAATVFLMLGDEARDAVPALIELYGKVSPECRPGIAFALGEIGPEAKKAVPLLILGLEDANTSGAVCAANALGQIHSEPQLVVPALINCLTNRVPDIRRQAVTSLAWFGADAKAAVPALMNSLNDSDQMVKQRANYALKQIDQEAAAKAGVK